MHVHQPAETARERRGSQTERKHRPPGVSTRRRTSEPSPRSIASAAHEPPCNRSSGVLRNWLGMLLISLISWPAQNGCRGIRSRGFSGVSQCIVLIFLSMQIRRAAAQKGWAPPPQPSPPPPSLSPPPPYPFPPPPYPCSSTVATPTCAGTTGQLCYYDPRCTATSGVTDPHGGVGCSAGGFDNCRFCGSEFSDIPCPNAIPSPPPPSPPPPSAPSPPGEWELLGDAIFPRDNANWRNSDGSSIRDDQVTTCGSVGTMLGGYQVFGNGAFVQTFVADLPPHTALRVQFTFIRVDLCTHAWASMPPKHPPNHAPRIAFTEVRTSRA